MASKGKMRDERSAVPTETMSCKSIPDVREAQRASGRAFTLVELLVTISIIALLVAILVPSVTGFMGAARDARTKVRITELSNATLAYYSDNKNRYPGQGLTNAQIQGKASALLPLKLLLYDQASGTWQSNYANYAEGMLMESGGDHYFSDEFRKEHFLPILYYPSRPVGNGSVSTSYAFAHNTVRTGSAPETETAFFKTIADTRMGDIDGNDIPGTDWPNGQSFVPANYRARNHDSFLLIAPGSDREYFDSMDITNW